MTIEEKLKDLTWQFHDYLISEKMLSANTVESYQSDIRQFYEYVCQDPHVQTLEELFVIENLDGFVIYLSNTDIGSRSILRKLSALSLFLKFLKLEGVIQDNASYLLERPKIAKKLPQYLTVNEVEQFLSVFNPDKPEGLRDLALFELIYSCGLRVSEIVHLDTNSIYLKERLVQIFGKGSKERYVPVGEKAAGIIEQYLHRSRPILTRFEKKTPALFVNFRGERLSRKGIWKNLKIARNLAGIRKDFSVHTLRHSFATHLIQNGADIRGVQTLLGHKNIVTTEIYTHLDLSFIREVYQRYHSHGK